MKWFWRVLLAVAAVLSIAVAGSLLFLRSGLPDHEGSRHLAGLDAPVQILRDRLAVPHIFASSDEDAYFALGYVHASDRLWQMDVQRRIGQGRVAELIGESGLRIDRLMRVLGTYRQAESSYRALPVEVQAALDSYAAGVNAWLEHHDGALPPEFYLLRYKPEPWRPADSLVWGRLIALQLSGNYREELLRARIASRLGEAALADLFPAIGAPPVTLGSPAGAGAMDRGPAPDPRLAGLLDRLAAALPEPLGPSSASNQWVVAGDRTPSGRPVLSNDPHLSLTAPIQWYMARIETPGLSLTGATVPGVPFLILGHNGRIAWGLTTSGADVQDLYVNTVDPEDPSRYLTGSGPESFTLRREEIAVGRGGRTEPLEIRETRHGPVISDVITDIAGPIPDDAVVSLAYTGYTEADIGAEAVYRLNRATDWPSFRAALATLRAPLQNFVYADVDGNIGFVLAGDIPLRASGDGTRPAQGDAGVRSWAGLIPFDELPSGLNPASGWLINANNQVVDDSYPHWLGHPYEESFRAARIEQVLRETASHGPEDAEALLIDTVSLAAERLVPHLLTVVPEGPVATAATDTLRRWDLRMDRDSPAPLLFFTWLRELNRTLYADELGPLFEDYAGLRPTVVAGMLTKATAWCDDVRTEAIEEDCADVLRVSLDQALDRLSRRHGADPADWRWGDEHVAPFRHQVFSRIPVLRRVLDLGLETDGGPYTVNRGAFWGRDEERPFEHQHGAGFRAVYDLADLADSRFIIATGQSGHPLSRHFGDQVLPWRDGRHVRLSGSPEELAQTGLGTLSLRPAE